MIVVPMPRASTSPSRGTLFRLRSVLLFDPYLAFKLLSSGPSPLRPRLSCSRLQLALPTTDKETGLAAPAADF